MFKHTLACYNACLSGKIAPKKLTLLNVIWKMPVCENADDVFSKKYIDRRNEEIREADSFVETMNPINDLFRNLGIEFEILITDIDKIISVMKTDSEHLRYLKRYSSDGKPFVINPKTGEIICKEN